MARYGVEMNRTASLTLPVGSLTAAAALPRRFKIYDLMFGSEATPADAVFLWEAFYVTAPGVATPVVPQSLDPSDTVASTVVGNENHTVDATPSGAAILAIPLNQRATFRWVASPEGELIAPAISTDGFAFYTKTASSLVAATATAHFNEI